MKFQHSALLAIILVVGVGTVPMIAAAEVSLTDEPEYSGGEEDADQAITTTVTLSPEGSQITDVTIRIRSTDQGFVDFNSFTKEVDPADSDVTVQSTDTPGTFQINELEPGETVSITFQIYPKTIKQTTLNVARIDVEYIQNGQELSARESVEADLSSSPWFKYQNAMGGNNNPLLLGGAVIGGVIIGAGIAFVGSRKSGGESSTDEESGGDFGGLKNE